jgi:S1-C subfamily serine protease
MKKLRIVPSLVFGIALSSVCYGQNQAPTQEDLIQKTIELAKSRYVGLVSKNVRTETNTIKVGSAFMVGCKFMVSNFHLLESDHRIADMNGEKNKPIISVGMNVEQDIIVFKSNTPNRNLTPIEFASEVKLGEILVNYSNADGTNGFARIYRVAKLSDGHILLDQPSLAGESGSALLNLKGQFAGLINSSAVGENNDRLYGRAIYPTIVKLTVDQILKNDNSCE